MGKINSHEDFKEWIAKQIRKDDTLTFKDIQMILAFTEEQAKEKHQISNIVMNGKIEEKPEEDEKEKIYSFAGKLSNFTFSDGFGAPVTWGDLLEDKEAMEEIYGYYCDVIKENDCDDNYPCVLLSVCANWYTGDDDIFHLQKCMKIFKAEDYIVLDL